jgi:hypothetical protein
LPVEQVPVFACYRHDSPRNDEEAERCSALATNRRDSTIHDSPQDPQLNGGSEPVGPLKSSVADSLPNSSGSGSGSSPEPFTGVAVDDDPDLDPLTANVRNIDRKTFRVKWFGEELSPALRFTFWSFRKLRLLPPEWRGYYRRLLRQEITASRHVSVTWDSFMMIVEGYRKVKWVLKKYQIPFNEAEEIPQPYGNFWESTTHEERLWAHRRSFQMKEMQAMQREDDQIVFGGLPKNMMESMGSRSPQSAHSGQQAGTPNHAFDLPAPSERDLTSSQADEDMSSALFASVEDDKLWNPVLKQRFVKASNRAEAELYAFEDEDEEEEEEVDRKGSS